MDAHSLWLVLLASPLGASSDTRTLHPAGDPTPAVASSPTAVTPTFASGGALPSSAVATRIWGDTDGDSRPDLYVVNPDGEDRLFRNQGDGSFHDVTTQSGLAGLSDTASAAFEDFDRDGWLDLLVVTRTGAVLVFRGEGNGTFRDAATDLGIVERNAVRAAQWLDYDGDGCLDLMLVAEGRGPVFFHGARGARGRTFARVELVLPGGPVTLSTASAADPAASTRSAQPPRPTAGERTTTATTDSVRGVAGAGASTRTEAVTSGGTTAASGGNTSQLAGGPFPPTNPELAPFPGPTCLIDPQTDGCVTVSTSPQFGSLYPLGEEFSIDENGNVSIGAYGAVASRSSLGPPVRRVHARTPDATAVAVFGEATSATGATEGVRGESLSPNGRGVAGQAPSEGVHGNAVATSGPARGVRGRSASDVGEGVLGEATETTGDNVGVRGTSASPGGRGIDGSAPIEGVRGMATDTTGESVGVRGTSASPGGRGIDGSAPIEGIRGAATDRTGIAVGVRGTSVSPAGRGVEGSAPVEGIRGAATDRTGLAVGVRGTSESPAGRGIDGSAPIEGIRGAATDTTGNSVGVRGTSVSPAGCGVEGSAPIEGIRGAATDTSGVAVGVRGTSASPAGRGVDGSGPSEGVRGAATDTSANESVGVRGTSASPFGRGVEGSAPRTGVSGTATDTTGSGVGVLGRCASPSGAGVDGAAPTVGVRGDATNFTGDSNGVRGSCQSPDGRGVEGFAPNEGVRGAATNPSGNCVGVRGTTVSTGTAAYGVLGTSGPTMIPPTDAGVGVAGLSNASNGSGVLGEAQSSLGSTFGVNGRSFSQSGTGVHGAMLHPTGEGYGVLGKCVSANPAAAGVYAAGSGAAGPGVPRAAALVLDSGAIVVKGPTSPAGTLELSGLSWTAITSCSPGAPILGYSTDVNLANDLIVSDSILLLTVDTDFSGLNAPFVAQVKHVTPGNAEIRIGAFGTMNPGCTPPGLSLNVNYLILNPE